MDRSVAIKTLVIIIDRMGQYIYCWVRQVQQVRQGGFVVLLTKALTLLLFPLLLPAVLMIRALRPLVVVRFGPLRSNVFGLLTFETEVYLCERDAGIHGTRFLDPFYHLSPNL